MQKLSTYPPKRVYYAERFGLNSSFGVLYRNFLSIRPTIQMQADDQKPLVLSSRLFAAADLSR